jgi:hypothetical protein
VKEKRPETIKTGILISDLPVVCILAIKGMKNDHNKVIQEFHHRIQDSEGAMFEQMNSENENFNEKIHRIQFGIIDVNLNSNIKSQILKKTDKKNPKFIVHISNLNLISIVNNLSFLIRRP